MLQQLVRLVFPMGSVRTVRAGAARGMRVVVEPGVGASYLLGRDEAAPRFFARVVKPGMSVVDVGANKGQMTLIFAALVGGTGAVMAWEPAPQEFASLCRNVALNRLPQVTTVQAAASDHFGSLAFHYDTSHPTQGKLAGVEPTYKPAGAHVINVDARPLDSLLDDGIEPDVIKIDTEGAGAAVLRGAAALIDQHGPSIYIELHGPEEQQAVKDLLATHGYTAQTPEGVPVADPTDGCSSRLWCTRTRARVTRRAG